MSENDSRSVQEKKLEKRSSLKNSAEVLSEEGLSEGSTQQVKPKPRTSPQTMRICDLSALELKRLCEFPEVEELEAAMETLARVAFFVKDDEARLRRVLKAIKTLQDLMNE